MKSAHNNTHTRRDFLSNMVFSGIGITGLCAFFQSCAEKEIPLSTGLAEAYIKGLLEIVEKIRKEELSNITLAANLAVQARLRGFQLYAYITGGMFPYETEDSRPGSPHIFLTDDVHSVSKSDVFITNDPETARGLGERNVQVIGITPPTSPNLKTPPGVFENMGTLLIEDVSDIVIYTHVPYTDGILNVEGLEIPICPASGVIQSLIYYALAAEIVEGLANSGIYPKIG